MTQIRGHCIIKPYAKCNMSIGMKPFVKQTGSRIMLNLLHCCAEVFHLLFFSHVAKTCDVFHHNFDDMLCKSRFIRCGSWHYFCKRKPFFFAFTHRHNNHNSLVKGFNQLSLFYCLFVFFSLSHKVPI